MAEPVCCCRNCCKTRENNGVGEWLGRHFVSSGGDSLIYRGACVSDLDGTLLPHNGEISVENLRSLESLSEKGICRVLATGRSLFSMRKVIPLHAPFDFVIFATGAGIMDWQNQELIYNQNLNAEQISRVCKVLEELNLDYMLHNAIPETHHLQYKAFKAIPDFLQRLEIYREYATELKQEQGPGWKLATQFLAIVESHREDLYDSLSRRLDPLTIIRTTSPLDFSSLWIEIFAPGVNKGSALQHLLSKIGLSLSQCMVIGNDYNDLQMLEICPNSYVTANAPDSMKQEFINVGLCEENGFSMALNHWLQSSNPSRILSAIQK